MIFSNLITAVDSRIGSIPIPRSQISMVFKYFLLFWQIVNRKDSMIRTDVPYSNLISAMIDIIDLSSII